MFKKFLGRHQVGSLWRKTFDPVHAIIAGLGVAALLLSAPFSSSTSRAAKAVPIAIADFDYVDTSGEVEDQTEKHKALVATLMEALRAKLGQSAKFRVVSVFCDGQPCSFHGTNPSDLMPHARSAGAKLLLVGGIHRESTLVQWAKVDVVDVERDKVVYDRLLSFRGDDAYAWRRAEEFLVKDLESADLSK
jgi:hypothetical protein